MQKKSTLFKPLDTQRAFEKISNQIKNLILSGELKPGDKLPSEREIAAQFRTGRMVVREALRILEQSDLIYIKQGSDGGAYIKELDTKHIANSFSDAIQRSDLTVEKLIEVRSGIEKAVIALAIERMSDQEIESLLQNINKADEMINHQTTAAEQHIDFHLLLAKGSKNQLYEMIIESLMTITHTFVETLTEHAMPLKEHIKKHLEIYNAIKERDVIKAQEKIEEHIQQISIWFSEWSTKK